MSHAISLRGVCLALLICACATFPAFAQYHSADTDPNLRISLSELLRVIQFFNSEGFHCEGGTEDGYAVGPGDTACDPHDSDYNLQDWDISLSELLRLIQFFNSEGYFPTGEGEDGFGPGLSPGEEATMDDIGELGDFIAGLPGGLLGDTERQALLDLLDEVAALLMEGKVCEAADLMDQLLGTAQELRLAAKKSGSPQKQDVINDAEFMYGLGRMIRYDVIGNRPDPTGLCPNHPDVGKGVEPEVGDSDPTGVDLTFNFGESRVWPSDPGAAGGDEVYSELGLPDVDKQGEPGLPCIPCKRFLVAIPPGAGLEWNVDTSDAETFDANILPFQPQPIDQSELDPPDPELFADRPFAKDTKLYDTNDVWPPEPVSITKMGPVRGLELVQVEVCGGGYNPVSDKLVLFKNVTLQLFFFSNFNGFIPEWMKGPFESNQDYPFNVLNSEAVLLAPEIEWVLQPTFLGEEFLILTHPNFRAAADALAAWKRTKGISTNVFECGTGSGITSRDTAQEIDAFIENRYNTVSIPPSYILLMGDAEYIPCFYNQRLGADPGVTIGTDWNYAWLNPPGVEFPPMTPTFALGRIPVDTLQQANDVVNKIIDYEQTPPGTIFSDAFYRNITFAGQFQCCRTDVTQVGRAQRTFTQVMETVRPKLVSQGYTVQRVYQRTIDGGCASCDPPRPAYTADPTPRRYYDGTALPAAVGPGSGFAWNGSGADVTTAFNDGRFLVFHRDHGWHSGWGHPPYSTGNLPLANGEFQPVLFSINCSSGYFDNETSGGAEGTSVGGVYFAERLLRQANGGAVGVIGDTRVSPSWPNSALARGLFDAIWPSVEPGYGSNTSKRRLGDILNHAKLYLATQIGVSGQGTSYADFINELYLYHVIGDPTLEIYTKDPYKLMLSVEFAVLESLRDRIILSYPNNGAVITALQDGPDGLIPVGRGTVVEGQVVIDYFEAPLMEEPLQLSATYPDAIPASGEIDIPGIPR
jgi:hypothetical protein